MSRRLVRFAGAVVAAALMAAAAEAQSLGTFRWQLQPYCNVVTVNVTQSGGVYTVDGYDDQCGAAQRAALVGLATPNPDGTIGFGLNIVTAPGGRGVQVDASITMAALSGLWTDSAGNSGTFAFGAGTGGSPRPAPASGAGTTIPSTFALLQDGGFLARGALNVGAIPASGAGTRMMWHPNKAAFRVGNVTGTQWDDANVGGYSIAMGWNTVADGGASTALGAYTTASGGNSTALGANTLANGGNSTAMGLETRAGGYASTALGYQTTASGEDASTAMGLQTTASGASSTAMGDRSRASGDYSTAMGSGTVASGNYSTAMGIQTIASGTYSTAMGFRHGQRRLQFGHGHRDNRRPALAPRSWDLCRGHGGAPGSFMYGDRSTVRRRSSRPSRPNEFLVRAAGGRSFYRATAAMYPT